MSTMTDRDLRRAILGPAQGSQTAPRPARKRGRKRAQGSLGRYLLKGLVVKLVIGLLSALALRMYIASPQGAAMMDDLQAGLVRIISEEIAARQEPVQTPNIAPDGAASVGAGIDAGLPGVRILPESQTPVRRLIP